MKSQSKMKYINASMTSRVSGQKAIDNGEREENADRRPTGWGSSKKENESSGSKEVAATSVKFVL